MCVIGITTLVQSDTWGIVILEHAVYNTIDTYNSQSLIEIVSNIFVLFLGDVAKKLGS